MAQRVMTTFIDDITGKELTEEQRNTCVLTLNGKSFRLDLSEASLKKVQDTFDKWTENAEKVPTAQKTGKSASGTSADRKAQLQAIREWAKGQGMEVSERGRIPAEVEEAFKAAH